MKNKIDIRIDKRYIKYIYKKIDIDNISYLKTYAIIRINEEDLEKIKGFKYEILSYHGINGLYHSIIRNKVYIITLILTLISILIISNLIIKIEIIHSDKYLRDLIRDELRNNGLHLFSFRKDYNEIEKIKTAILRKNKDRIEWIEIVNNGMKYTIRVEERIIKRPHIDKNYCDVISTNDAIVLETIVNKGQDLTRINDKVKKGDILISGAIKYNDEIKNYVCAKGKVYGNTWYKVNISVPLKHTTKLYTNTRKKNIAYRYNKNYKEIFKVHLKNYDTKKTKLLKIGNFTLYKVEHLEYIKAINKYKESDALEVAKEMAREKLKLNFGRDIEIISEKVLQRNTYNSIINLEIFYSIKKEISETQELNIFEEKEGN